MSTLLLVAALILSVRGEHDHAQVVAIGALTFAVLRLKPGVLAAMWRDSVAREQAALGDGTTLFRGDRDDD